jgi:hypothetical protein
MSPQGPCAWDVRRLVELSRPLSVERVLLFDIRELDEPYWSGDADRRMTCRDVVDHARLIQECDLSFPVIWSSDGRVMDGMHRICKALLEGKDSVRAVRFVVDPKPDYVGISPNELPYDN